MLTEVEKKQRKAISNRKYLEKNRAKILKWNALWANKNPYKNHKSKTLFSWRRAGIIDSDLHKLYDFVMEQTNCWVCDKQFGTNRKLMNHRSLDHDHDTGEFRLVCCTACNLFIVKE